MRTHLLVSLGAGLFTELSIFGFGSAPAGAAVDPTRIAAQVVTGIGFLGGGAILKYGTTIRGLTTAGSLWSTAAIGMAAGAGAWVLAVVGTVIVLFSLWPLNAIVHRIRPRAGRSLRLRLELTELAALSEVTKLIVARTGEIVGVTTERRKRGYEVELDVRLPPGAKPHDLVGPINAIDGVEVIEAAPEEE
jgi:putative Mg2+ transporter-C (MgtC) family protein